MLDELLIRFARWIIRKRACSVSHASEHCGSAGGEVSLRMGRREAERLVREYGGKASVQRGRSVLFTCKAS